jgi:hypothetical protein
MLEKGGPDALGAMFGGGAGGGGFGGGGSEDEWKSDEEQPPPRGGRAGGTGLHSFTSQLNLSDDYGIGDARKGCVRPY